MDKKRNPRLFRIALIAVLLCGALLAGILLFATPRFPERTLLCGQDVSGKTVSASEDLFRQLVSGYQLKLTLEGKEYILTAGDLGLTFQQDTFRQKAADALKAGTVPEDRDVLQWDDAKLEAFLDQNFDQRRSDAVQAEIRWNESIPAFEHIPGRPQTWYSREKVAELIVDAVARLEPELTITSDEIFQENSENCMEDAAHELTVRANEMLSAELELVFDPRGGSREVVRVDMAALAPGFRFDPDAGVITLDESVALGYAGELAKGRNVTGGKAGFLTHGNMEIDIPVSVPDSQVDTAALAADLCLCVRENLSGSREVAYVSAVTSPNFAGTYIEVSIPEQHMWYYENGIVVLDADIVTGKVLIGADTPTGCFQIYNHYSYVTLFQDEFVDRWMAFFQDGSYGFHDADHWREPEEYGGKTYIRNGSAGCVNVPIEKMLMLYERVKIGTPVVIYNQRHIAPVYGTMTRYWDDSWGKLDMDLTIRAQDAKITYSSSDESIATVSQDGIVTPQSRGSVVIYAHVEATEEYDAYTHELYLEIY